MAVLEKSSREQSEKVKLLEARVETLEQDNSAMKDRASKLQEKVMAAAKEKKGILFLIMCPSSSFLLFSFFPCFDVLKSLLLQRDELVIDLKKYYVSSRRYCGEADQDQG